MISNPEDLGFSTAAVDEAAAEEKRRRDQKAQLGAQAYTLILPHSCPN